jgi:predicted aspartyl protease
MTRVVRMTLRVIAPFLESLMVEAVIDTAYNGELILPLSII